MESDPQARATEASLALGDVARARTALSDRLAPGLGFLATLGMAVALSIALAGTGFAQEDPRLAVAGAGVITVVGGTQLWLVRRRTGVWVSDLAHRVVLGGGSLAAGSFVVALLATVWAASSGLWWVVALLSAAGGAGYALGGHRWLSAYHRHPEGHVGSDTRLALAVLATVAVAGLVLLLLVA